MRACQKRGCDHARPNTPRKTARHVARWQHHNCLALPQQRLAERAITTGDSGQLPRSTRRKHAAPRRKAWGDGPPILRDGADEDFPGRWVRFMLDHSSSCLWDVADCGTVAEALPIPADLAAPLEAEIDALRDDWTVVYFDIDRAAVAACAPSSKPHLTAPDIIDVFPVPRESRRLAAGLGTP
jgi:hypothetical protein